jgi:hypothetical protein
MDIHHGLSFNLLPVAKSFGDKMQSFSEKLSLPTHPQALA